ncbi:hypothetical protein RQP46_001430 [Phenoliferia psychrophenolica]
MTPAFLALYLILPLLPLTLAQSTDEWTHLSPATIEQLRTYAAEKAGSTTIPFYPISTFVLWANILGIFYTAVVFALQMACMGMFASNYTVSNIHCLKVAGTIITTLYLFEITYRPVMRYQMLAHHFCTIFAIIFVIVCLGATDDPSLFVTALCWVFQASTEQVQFAGLLMYRFKCAPRAVSSTLRIGAAQALVAKMCSSVYVFIWWFQRQSHHTHPTEIAFSVILVLVMSCLMITQFYGSYVVWILSSSYERKYFAGDAARLGDRDGARTPGSMETREEPFLDSRWSTELLRMILVADTRSVILERGGVRMLALRPASLASCPRKAETVFDLPIGSVALQVSIGGLWVQVLEDGWKSAVLSVQDPLALKVVDKVPLAYKRARSVEAEANDGHVCSKARKGSGQSQASGSRGAVNKAKEKERSTKVTGASSSRTSSLRSAASKNSASSVASAPPEAATADSPSSRNERITLLVKAVNFTAEDFHIKVARFEDLFPPTPLANVRVDLSLVPQWSFSALYPVVPINRAKAPHGGSTASWTVSASPSGDLIETSSGLSLSYLFWEAHTSSIPPSPPLLPTTSQVSAHTSSIPPSPPLLPTTSQVSAFNPANTTLTPSTALALPFPDFLPYLDRVLSTLTLHTSARNDFITYWLPKFIAIRDRGQRIAFRFVEQAAYEQAARLEVDPKPDVVTRVFMTFKGVGMDGVEWTVQGKGAKEVDWRTVVGIESAASDESRFRVLEWGGMELLR